MNGLTHAVRQLGSALRGKPAPADKEAEQRVEQRVSKRLTVGVLGRTLISTNVTEAGLQATCPRPWVEAFRDHPGGTTTPVQLLLPDGNTVGVACEVIYVSPCDGEFLVGLGFKAFDEASRGLWQAYVDRLKESA